MAFAALVVGVVVGAHGHERSSIGVARTFSILTPDLELGDNCVVIDSVACDTMEFDVELKSPARSVVASIGNRVMKLQPIPSGDGFPAPDEITGAGSGPWTGFYGYLEPSGSGTPIRHPATAAPPKSNSHRPEYLQVRLAVTYPDGQHGTADVESQPLRVDSNPRRAGAAQRLAQAAAAAAAAVARHRRGSHPG